MLCESGNLTQALNFLHEDTHNATSSSVRRAEAMGVLLQACGRQKDIDTGRLVTLKIGLFDVELGHATDGEAF
ncbi:hypothetical protein FNV43_RR20742 [Rhamnella rubrinervis]|uniref:Uncharacterized protein n=1 Tax=Rhamnella rubrinervis TaxID=2594499 RepID=A0A8K0E0A8_9ROSA|nr:hypothetical protein FNV43_RR20742 [Rhamnella rubrinervis]